MTSNTLLSKIKSKIIIVLIIVGLLCTSLAFLTACSDDDSTSDIPSYSYTDTDDGLISNPNFNYNTSSIALENFPQTSPTGWSRAKDSDGISSSAKSGVIDISADGWTAFLNTIYSDSYYLDYLENKLGFNKTDIETEAEEENSSITTDELKAKVVEAYSSKLSAPTQANATDNKVYMLNNYTKNINQGASQKITSSKAITINKGEYVKISVDVFTQNITTKNSNNNDVVLGLNGANDEFGASIRLTNTINGSSQAEYAITNINTNGAWKTYTLYVKGDAEFDCTVTLALGLGYSDLYPTEGTVYFDNVIVEELETVSTLPSTVNSLTYGGEDAILVNAGSNAEFLYDMTLNVDDTYYKNITPTITGGFTTANGITSQNKGWTTSTGSYASNTVTVKDASYSLVIEDTDNFKVEREQYAYFSFKLNNNLNKLGNTTITVDVYETTTGNPLSNKKPAVASVSETGETTVGIMIKNNFDENNAAFQAQNERTFCIVVVVGPTNITSTDNISDYASGTVEISDFKIAKGDTYQYVKDGNGDLTETETDNYTFYQLFNGIADGSTSLYAGYTADYSSTEESNTSTGFGIAATYKEYLKYQPVAPSEYNGVGFDHIYLNEDSQNSNINDRTNGNTSTDNVAGVIDTQHLATYNNGNLSGLSNFFDQDDKIRPLMIYNKSADSYGFISNKDAQVISANSYAKISLKVKVDTSAKAYIYLVDTSTKDVMTFDNFTPNSNGLTSISGASEKVGEEFMFVVENTNGEWVDVIFYIATGKTEKSFRLELWNGSRDGVNKSTGYVFFNSVSVTLSSGFSEPASFKDSFTSSSSPLYAQESTFSGANEYLCYSRTLTETEKEFNEEYPDNAVSYSPKIIWAKNDSTLYAIFNTIDVEEIDPYDTIVEEETEDGSGCAAETDPATFWLSFSSILLVVVLVLAIVALIVKKVRRKRKANASDAKSHYTVKSRVRKAPAKATKAIQVEETAEEQIVEDVVEEANDEIIEEASNEEEIKENDSDDYVYGDVQDFGENDENKQ